MIGPAQKLDDSYLRVILLLSFLCRQRVTNNEKGLKAKALNP